MSVRTATTRLLSPRPALFSASTFTAKPRIAAGRRPFITLPGNDTQNLTASRTLPYARDPLYELIADVDSYSEFVPFCPVSRVTRWSAPDPAGRRWPTLADLHVGWGGFNESFTSRLRCEPGVFVEAVSGEALGPGEPAASPVFKSIITSWSLRPLKDPSLPSTEVLLSIKYQFANPLYAALSSAVSDQVAGLMVEAFEKRAMEKLGSSRSA